MMCSKWKVPFFPCMLSPEEQIEEQFQRDLDIFNTLARQTGFTVVDVIGDGHCLFASVEFGFLKLGIQRTKTSEERIECTCNITPTHWMGLTYGNSSLLQ